MDTEQKMIEARPDEAARQFYLHAMETLDRAGVEYVLGGGYAMRCYTGIERNTKDLDLFIRKADREQALESLAAAGYRTERTWPHFLVKAISGESFVDLLYNSGNGLCPVDE